MTQGEAVKAYKAIIRMGNKAAGEAAFSLFRMKKQLKEIVDFQSEEEEKLIKKHGGAVTEAGQVIIVDPKEREAFLKEREEIEKMECNVAPVIIRADNIPEITLAEIEALDGFVNFTEVESNGNE